MRQAIYQSLLSRNQELRMIYNIQNPWSRNKSNARDHHTNIFLPRGIQSGNHWLCSLACEPLSHDMRSWLIVGRPPARWSDDIKKMAEPTKNRRTHTRTYKLNETLQFTILTFEILLDSYGTQRFYLPLHVNVLFM